jgi:indolepyruvate ferredoxin oxidoreductase beta subunit
MSGENKKTGLDIMIVGVGGQGTLLASRVIGNAAVQAGMDVKVSEVHGMSQRGGSVETYVRVGESIASPLIDRGGADVVMCFEKLEALRFLPYLKPDGILIVNEQEIDPMPVITGVQQYPADVMEQLRSRLGAGRVISLDAAAVALDCGDIRTVNVVLLGVLAGMQKAEISREIWEHSVSSTVPVKALPVNLRAFEKGYERGVRK